MNKSKGKKYKLKNFPLGIDELHKLSKTDSGIVLRENCPCRLQLNYSVLPIGSQQFKDAVKEELNKRILKYNTNLNDMILKYCNVRVITPVEANQCRKLNVSCVANVYVFKPKCDSILTGIVNKKSKNHIGCIMYDVFNVSLIKPQDMTYNQWPGRHVNLEDEVTFKVIKVDISEVIPYIVGEFIHSENEVSNASAENDEKDSVISTDHNSLVTSEERFSDLDDVMETIIDVKSRKRKLSDKPLNEGSVKKRKKI